MISASDRVRTDRRLDRRTIAALVGSLVLLGALVVWRASTDRAPYEVAGTTMGTTFSVKIDAEVPRGQGLRIRDVIQTGLDDVTRLMSTYDSTSELSRFNRHLGSDPVAASDELLEVLAAASVVSERSGGAFDVTVAPLVDAWGFGPTGQPLSRPDQTRLAELRERVGYGRIRVDGAAGMISKSSPETFIDLSAIAKGYAVDLVASDLVALGFTRHLVEVGGELRATGSRRDGRPWRVGIERPDAAVREVHGTVELVDQAMATSGDYRNFSESEGVRYAHIIDPRTGSPVPFRGASVSVAHAEATMADAWATALMVLGPTAGFELAVREGIAALFITHSDGGFRSRSTPMFTERIGAVAEVTER